MSSKQCRKCYRFLEDNEFHKNQSWCKYCQREYRSAYYRQNKSAILLQAAASRHLKAAPLKAAAKAQARIDETYTLATATRQATEFFATHISEVNARFNHVDEAPPLPKAAKLAAPPKLEVSRPPACVPPTIAPVTRYVPPARPGVISAVVGSIKKFFTAVPAVVP